jgi:hypothetical protein
MVETSALRIVVPLEQLAAFFPLLQQGVWLRAEIGCSVASLLTDQFGIAEDYIVERITTLFLDFKPIDDLQTTYVNNDSTLALSSAMPGLVGTTMRRGSHLAAMRGDISCKTPQYVEPGMGRVKIKLFNMVMKELAATFLAHGICLLKPEIDNFLNEMNDNLWETICSAFWGDQQIDPASLVRRLSSVGVDDEILLKIEFKS